jgi:imidazolonepropionase-like amidohydrolase
MLWMLRAGRVLATLSVLTAGTLFGGSSMAQSRAVAFTNVTVIDGTGAAPRSDMTVVVDGGRIVVVGRTRDVRVPTAAAVVDGRGKFLIPGLWDMHVHLGEYGAGAKVLRHLVASGIVGVRDMASPPDDILRLRADVESGTLLGPQIVAAGPILQAPLPFRPPSLVRSVAPSDAAAVVDELRGKGVDFIKVGDTLDRNTYFVIASESKRVGLTFAGHLPVSVSAMDAAMAGQRSIEHFGSAVFRGLLLACSRDEGRLAELTRSALAGALAGGPPPEQRLYQADVMNALVDTYDSRKASALFAVFRREGTWQTPTLQALRQVWEERRKQLNGTDVAAGERLQTQTLDMFRQMRRERVNVLAGTDVPTGAGAPPLHDELVELVRAGLTPMQALQAATRNPAEFLGRLAGEGTIQVGKKANVVLLDADPLVDISNTRRVSAVILAGRLIPREEIQNLR